LLRGRAIRRVAELGEVRGGEVPAPHAMEISSEFVIQDEAWIALPLDTPCRRPGDPR
jgi:hypothetical protein